MSLSYGSVCSGIEAASVAWESLGWQPAWFSEIEKFPSAVLAHYWPHVPNLGDMTTIAARIRAGTVPAPDVLVGGTPCQAFSVAGLRNGLSDKRGQLTISYVELADAIDTARSIRGQQPAILVWENVPGVLSAKGNAFGCFLGALAGEDCELKPPGRRWTSAGCVYGSRRTIAWRTLDAQFFGVAQRRKRVFVVASALEGVDPTEILFEFDGMRRDSPPRRSAPQDVAGTLGASLGRSRGAGQDTGSLTASFSAGNSAKAHGIGYEVECAPPLRAGESGNNQVPTIVHSYTASSFGQYVEGIGTLRSAGGDLGGGSETLIATFPAQDPAHCLQTTCSDYSGADGFNTVVHQELIAFDARQDPISSPHISGALGCSHPQASAVVYSLPGNWVGRAPENGGNSTEPMIDLSPCQTATDIHAVCYDTTQITSPDNRANPKADSPCHTLAAKAHVPLLVERFLRWVVRRLMPIECERLQGFPDNYTNITIKGKPALDGPRYKALGNSMAVPCMHWIGKRIDFALRLIYREAA